MNESSDPIRVQREKIANLVSKGMRAGTALYVVASTIFFIGFATGFTRAQTYIIVALLVVGSLLLAPAMVFNYGVKAANRADRDDSW